MMEEDIMNSEKQKIIKETLNNVVPYIDNLPMGEFIPSSWQAPKTFKYEKLMVGEVPVEHIVPIKKKKDCVILQIHGGGYVVALSDPFRTAAVQYSNIAGGAEVFSLDYRVAPKHHYPAALEDAVKVYKWLLEQGYDNNKIIIVGDSAGGNLTLATTLYLKDHQISLPKAVIAISPWTNAANDFPSVQLNTDKDVILGRNGLAMGNQIDDPFYFQGADLKEPYVSPVLGDYTGFPNLLIQVGSYEILLDDAVKVAEKARKSGVNVKITIYEGMSHDFQLLIPTLEESKNAWKEIKEFIEDNV